MRLFCSPYGFLLPHFASSLLVAKLTSVPRAAVNAVCRTSPSEILAQMEQMVPPIAEMRMSFTFITHTPFQGVLSTFPFRQAVFPFRCSLAVVQVRPRLGVIQYRFYDTKAQGHIL